MTLYGKIRDELRQAIEQNVLKAGEKIYSIVEMKEKYHISHITALRVYKELSGEGLIECRRGQGYFVREPGGGSYRVTGRFGCFVRTMRMPNNHDNYFNEINIGIQHEASRRQVDLLLSHNAVLDAMLPSERMLKEVRDAVLDCAELVDGFLLDERIPDKIVAEINDQTRKPVVVVNRKTSVPVNMVYPDNRLALETLLSLGRKMGYSQFVYCSVSNRRSYEECHFNYRDREELFCSMTEGWDCEIVEDCLIGTTEHFLKRTEEVLERRLKNGKVLVICATDHISALLMQHFVHDGKPWKNLGIAGLDGIEFSRNLVPALTTMRVDTFQIGRKAMEVLMQSVNGAVGYAPTECRVPSVFIPGETID